MGNDFGSRSCNTGAQKPLRSDLRACVDWVQATFKNITTDQLIFYVLGLDLDGFRETIGQYGYQKCKRLDNIAVYYNGSVEMGIHLEMSGQGCRQFESLSNNENVWTDFFKTALDEEANFSRLDGAIDDFYGHFKIDDMIKKIKKGELVSKFKKARWMESLEIKTGGSEGVTIYYGSSKSRIQIRMYEKDCERKNAGYELEEGVDIWNRTEVQARDERAQKIAELIANGDDIGEIVAGILKHYLRFTMKGKDKQKSRWKTAPFWERFLGEVGALKLTEQAPDRTVERTEEWIKKQVAPSLAVLMRAYDGDVGRLYKIIKNGNNRLKTKDVEMVDRFKRQNKSLDLGEIKGKEKTFDSNLDINIITQK